MTSNTDRRTFIRATSRAGHAALLDAALVASLSLTPDGTRLQRTYRLPKPRGQTRSASSVVRDYPWIRSGGVLPVSVPAKYPPNQLYGHAYEVAHVLRVGRDGPLIPPGTWAPIDGDWLNVTPSNWRNTDNPAARLPGSAPATPAEDDNELF